MPRFYSKRDEVAGEPEWVGLVEPRSSAAVRFEGLGRGATVAAAALGDRREKSLERLHEPLTAAREGGDNLLVRDWRDVRAAGQAGVEVGDDSQRDVAHPQFPGKYHLWVLGHPDDVSAHLLEPL